MCCYFIFRRISISLSLMEDTCKLIQRSNTVMATPWLVAGCTAILFLYASWPSCLFRLTMLTVFFPPPPLLALWPGCKLRLQLQQHLDLLLCAVISLHSETNVKPEQTATQTLAAGQRGCRLTELQLSGRRRSSRWGTVSHEEDINIVMNWETMWDV